MTDVPKKRNCIQLQTRETIAKLYDFMKQDAQEIIDLVSQPQFRVDQVLLAELKVHLNATQERTAKAVGVSKRTVQQIISEKRNFSFKSPYQNRKAKKRKLDINDFNIKFVESYIERHHAQLKTPPTFEDMLKLFHQELYYTGSKSTLRAFLAKLGYKWQKIDGKFVIVK